MEGLNGAFVIKHSSPGGEMRPTLTFNVTGENTFEGTVASMDAVYPMINCAINGDEVTFAYVQETPMGPQKPTYRGKLDGDSFNGKVKLGGPFGVKKFTGERVK